MITERKTALKMWEEIYGKSVEATDFTGRKMNKSAYEQKNSKYGWTVTCLLPRSAGGKAEVANLICVHTETAEEKGEDYPFFVAADKKYEISYVIEAEEWVIEEAHDSASIAEAEAKIAAAMSVWEGMFGQAEEVKDFSGREMHKSEFATDSEFAWKLAPYVDSKPMENKNVYIASILTIDETLGKTAFKANGKNFTLNKENGTYHFKELEIKPPKKEYDVKNPYDVAKKISEISNATLSGDSVMLDFIVIRAVTNNGATASNAQSVADTVNSLLKDCGCDLLGCEVSEIADEQGARYMFITLRFPAAAPSDFEKVFEAAQLLNTYSSLIMPMLNLCEFKIYNYAEFINRAHLRFSVGMLSGYYPQFAAFMDSIYKSAEGFYPAEAPATLYVSNMIIVNIPYLLEIHPQETEQFYTAVYLAEHNYPELSMLGVIQGVLAGVPEKTDEVSSVAEFEPIAEQLDLPEKEPEYVEEGTFDSDTVKPAIDETEEITASEESEESVWISAEDDDELNADASESDAEAENEPQVRSTPEGEQLTMAFPTMSDGQDGEEEIFTLELDSFN